MKNTRLVGVNTIPVSGRQCLSVKFVARSAD